MATASNPRPSALTWLGIARELTVGTPLLPTTTVALDKNSFSPEDTPKFLPDEAIRGVMATLYDEVLGVEDATFSFGGPAFLDTVGYWFDNCFGDLSSTGTSPTSSTTLSGATTVGATSCSVVSGTGYSIGSVVQIDSGAIAEIVVLTAVTTNTLTFTNNPLRFAHASAATVAIVTAPYTHVFALLNSGDGQPPTHTLTDRTGLTPTVGARAYPGACVSQIDLTGNAEQLLMSKVSGNSWMSAAAASAPTNTTSFTVPQAAWQSTVSVGGSSVTNVGEWALSFKRTLQTYWTASNQQTPFIIARGGLDITGTLNYTVATDDSPLTQMTSNTQPTVVISMSNGLSGANLLSISVTLTKAAFLKAKPDRNAVLVGYQDEYTGVANTTDVGGSAGLGPGTVTITNAVPTY